MIMNSYERGYRMDFEKVIVHILDCEHNTNVTSTTCLTELQPEVEKMLQTKANKVFASSAKKAGVFKEGSRMLDWLHDYKHKTLDFIQVSKEVATYIFNAKMKYGLYEATDLMVCEILQEGRRYLFVLDNSYNEGITHVVLQNENEVVNDIIPYRTLLSANFTKHDRAFLIELSDYSMHCVESKVEIEGEKMNFFADIVLESTTSPSYKEAVRSISKITEDMADKYDLDEIEIIPKMKSILMENVDHQTPIHIEDIASVLFADKPLAKEDFKEELRKQGVQNDIAVEYVKTSKAEKVQKIKTDKGIEIIIPVDYMNTKEFVEFKNLPDGTISIQLKNIMHFTSK